MRLNELGHRQEVFKSGDDSIFATRVLDGCFVCLSKNIYTGSLVEIETICYS